MEDKKNNVKRRGIIILVLTFLLIIVWIYIRDKRLDKNGVYSIATIENVEAIRGSMKVTISFPFENRKIVTSSGGFSIDKRRIGERYYVKFLSDNPNGIFYLLLDLKVPDSIKDVPYNGWNHLP